VKGAATWEILMGLETKLLEIQSQFKRSPSWGWDNRYQCLLAVQTADEAENLNEQLGDIFENAWGDEAGKTEYPPEIQKLLGIFEGLRSDQTLYTIAVAGGFIYATTWPWVRSTQVSFRMGFFQPDATDEEHDATQKLLQKVYWDQVFEGQD